MLVLTPPLESASWARRVLALVVDWFASTLTVIAIVGLEDYSQPGSTAQLFVLVAYVVSLALGMVPVTPGGLGFVETGLTTLLVLAGADTDQAVVGTLLYRLASFWIPIPLGALAWGGWRVARRDPITPAPHAP